MGGLSIVSIKLTIPIKHQYKEEKRMTNITKKRGFNATFLTAISCLSLLSAAQADIYPGDMVYSNLVQDIYHDISSDNINLAYDNNYADRSELCQKLIDQHNNQTPGAATQTNASFIGETISLANCENALWYSNGYTSHSDLEAWSGLMTGTWYDESGSTFSDPAMWQSPINMPTSDPAGDIGSDGLPRVYAFQEVIFSGADRVGQAKYGWNQSHPDVSYIWGWDPKNNEDDGGNVGTHVGWTFDQGPARCIIWITKNEAFLECVKNFCEEKRRTSAGLFGIGQWQVAPMRTSIQPIDTIRPRPRPCNNIIIPRR